MRIPATTFETPQGPVDLVEEVVDGEEARQWLRQLSVQPAGVLVRFQRAYPSLGLAQPVRMLALLPGETEVIVLHQGVAPEASLVQEHEMKKTMAAHPEAAAVGTLTDVAHQGKCLVPMRTLLPALILQTEQEQRLAVILRANDAIPDETRKAAGALYDVSVVCIRVGAAVLLPDAAAN